MGFHQISLISHFRIKYEFGISFKKEIWEKLDKKDGCGRRDLNDVIFINVKENEKEEKSTARTVGLRKIFTKGISWGI